ncbi:MAG: hypothetical protein JWO05_1051 [Gemmatimonadetes bacterium]|nr:hypothetical protein [Gemmatimonadota bacterium]
MPFGSSALGAVYFGAVKLIGYSAAGYYVNRREGLPAPRPLIFGATRAIIGVVVGSSYGYAYERFAPYSSPLPFYLGLIPIRILEWLFVFWLFYRHVSPLRQRLPGYTVAGILWSFVLDIPAMATLFVLPGGFWIC